MPSTWPAAVRSGSAQSDLAGVRGRRHRVEIGLGLLRPALLVDELGQAPVEKDDLAELTQHDVRALQVTVNHVPAMGERHRVADPDERLDQGQEVGTTGLAGGAFAVIVGDRVGKGSAADEPHGVVGAAALCARLAAGQLVNRHDAGMVELAGDPGLLEKSPKQGVVVGPVGTQLLEGDLAVHRRVAGQPDLTDPPLCVKRRECVPVAGLGGLADHRETLDCAPGAVRALGMSPRLCRISTSSVLSLIPSRVAMMSAAPDAAAIKLWWASPECFLSFRSSNCSTSRRSSAEIQPRSTRTSASRRSLRADQAVHASASCAGVDHLALEGQHPKQQVSVSVDAGHGGSPAIERRTSNSSR